MKILHTADLHFQNNPELLQEVVRVTDYLVEVAAAEKPDVIILAGDTLDEYHGRIRLDSDAARAAIRCVQNFAEVAPVVIVRGTKSHDREAPFIFEHLRTKHPVYVASEPELVGLYHAPGGSRQFSPVGSGGLPLAVFTLCPSLDKQFFSATFDGGIRDGNVSMRELAHDLFAGFGLVNETVEVPRILVTHGMVTGAVFSTGQQAIGEDLELGLDTLRAAKCDYVALGHVHKRQTFGRDVAYSGSPGRMNFGEQEEKGALLVEVERGKPPVIRFVPTPARKFVFVDVEWDGIVEAIHAAIQDALTTCRGCHVRVRYSIPEEHRHAVNRDEVEKALIAAGALKAKVECQIIPATRTRAAGISRASTLPEKVEKWAATTGVDVPPRVLEIASVIEGMEVAELQKF